MAPPGLTPAEAEEGRWLFENIPWNKCSEPAGEWKGALPEERAAWAEVERKAHAEGAKAAKAKSEKVSEFFRRHGSILQGLCWRTAADCERAASSGIGNMVESAKNYRALADEIAALATELETGKA